MSVFERVRSACADVSGLARSVHIVEVGLRDLAHELAVSAASPAQLDPAHRAMETAEDTAAHVITLDAVNFGSGWFPHLAKRPGCSGYFTIATALSERFAAHGAMPASELLEMTAERCASLFGQRMVAPIDTLMEHFAQAWRDLGGYLLDHHRGEFSHMLSSAGGRAEKLVEILTGMSLYRDVAVYEGFEVPLYKRAQITCADLASAFERRGPGAFADLDSLTIFADNLVPHVLRMEGALHYAPALLARIEAGDLIPAGSREEVEIRAVALHAVERMVELLQREGVSTTARRLDDLLWNRGQSPAIKAEPRHRTRSVYY